MADINTPTSGGSGKLSERETKTAFNPRKPGRFPGDFKITRCTLISPTRGADAPIDLHDNDKPDWTEINFYEDIYQPVVKGDITINDAVGIIEATPIIGEEILEISMSTAGAQPTPIADPAGTNPPEQRDLPKLIHNRFRIYRVDPPQKTSDTFRTIKLYFVSDIEFSNQMIKVQKNYPTGEITSTALPENPVDNKTFTIADMVRDIFYESFVKLTGGKKPANHRPTNKNLLVEPTKGLYTAFIPDWTPFKAIKFLAKRALSMSSVSKGANFVFYETLKGFRFVSVETLMVGGFSGYTTKTRPTRFPHFNTYDEEAKAGTANTSFIPVFDGETHEPKIESAGTKGFVATYTYQPGNISGQSMADKKFAVEYYSLVHTFDTLKNLGMGLYANRVITHDLKTMSWAKNDFHYVEPDDVVNFVDATTQTLTTTTNSDKPADDAKVKIDTAMKTDPGKICSNAADMLGRPESHIALFPTNERHDIMFAEGARKTTFVDKEGKLGYGIDQTMTSVHGSPSSSHPKETDRRVEEWLSQRISQRRQLETVKVQFKASGDSSREVGDLIWFNFPSENPEDFVKGGVNTPHKYFSGKFLITALRHKVTNDEYTISVEAIKDGYRSQISKGFGLSETTFQNPDGTVSGSSAIGPGGEITKVDGRVIGGF